MSLKQINQTERLSSRPKMRMSRREETQVTYEQLWDKDPEQFHLNRSARSRSCAQAAWELIKKLPIQTACDLGSGCGYFTKRLHDQGITVEAVDIAKPALALLSELPERQKIQAYVPYTPLPDHHYDLVIAYDLIASIPDSEQRLFFSELSRLAKDNGTILVSTNLDINSENP
ncbi:MAG: class I SAM-dependent methyltransferase, partial [Parachlamydiaceae bacterium]